MFYESSKNIQYLHVITEPLEQMVQWFYSHMLVWDQA